MVVASGCLQYHSPQRTGPKRLEGLLWLWAHAGTACYKATSSGRSWRGSASHGRWNHLAAPYYILYGAVVWRNTNEM
jgi:hypothetical protein